MRTATRRLPPAARGPLSVAVLELVSAGPPDGTARPAPAAGGDPWGQDHQLALHLCYELHDRRLPGAHPDWEWDPGLLAFRQSPERPFLAALRAEAGPVPPLADLVEDMLSATGGGGPSVYLLTEGERRQAREYLVHRSLYHLEEADP
ncbi:hypothetical protein ACIPYS_29420 [Kitasatospora sp. NPDC089913]|uniref:hypothetical protein n=1 Tax=Kitasatospora sp. NPDC089913 TaxID=3364080 RepID=UPI0037F8699E